MHAANSAAMLRDPAAHFDMVRCGIAVYGMDPFGEDPARARWSRRLSSSSRRRGQGCAGRGRAPATAGASWPSATRYLGVLPIGYGDGWRRGLSNDAEVLIGGRRYPLVGTVSMDNVTVDLGAGRAERVARGAGGADRRSGARADHRGGARAASGHDQLRDHLWPDAARAALLPPRRRAAGPSASDPPSWRHRGMNDGLRGRPHRRWPAPRPGWWAARCATALLGRPTADLDVVVDGDPAQAARAVARAAGRAACFALSEDFGAWRVVARDGSWQVDVEPMRGGSLEADLALRDFTVNAIAEPLAGGAHDRSARRA